jgi:hypothetical protein
MSLRALKGRGNLSLLAKGGNLIEKLRLLRSLRSLAMTIYYMRSLTSSEQSEGIFFAPRDDT